MNQSIYLRQIDFVNNQVELNFSRLNLAKNNADMLVHATRKSISEAGDRLTEEEKDSVETSTVNLEEAIKQDSLEAIEEATKNLNEVLTPLTQKLYPQAEEGSSETADENSSDKNTVDAEFEEVKEEEK